MVVGLLILQWRSLSRWPIFFQMVILMVSVCVCLRVCMSTLKLIKYLGKGVTSHNCIILLSTLKIMSLMLLYCWCVVLRRRVLPHIRRCGGEERCGHPKNSHWNNILRKMEWRQGDVCCVSVLCLLMNAKKQSATRKLTVLVGQMWVCSLSLSLSLICYCVFVSFRWTALEPWCTHLVLNMRGTSWTTCTMEMAHTTFQMEPNTLGTLMKTGNRLHIIQYNYFIEESHLHFLHNQPTSHSNSEYVILTSF